MATTNNRHQQTKEMYSDVFSVVFRNNSFRGTLTEIINWFALEFGLHAIPSWKTETEMREVSPYSGENGAKTIATIGLSFSKQAGLSILIVESGSVVVKTTAYGHGEKQDNVFEELVTYRKPKTKGVYWRNKQNLEEAFSY